MKIALAVVCALAACGGDQGKDKQADPPAGSGSSATTEKHHAHHMHVAADLKRFQDALGDKWHQPKGDQRMKDTCGIVAAMETSAGDIGKAAAPKGAEDKWPAGTKDLTDAVGSLKTACGANDAATFDPALEKVHKTFHSLLGMSGGHHEGDGTHEHSM